MQPIKDIEGQPIGPATQAAGNAADSGQPTMGGPFQAFLGVAKVAFEFAELALSLMGLASPKTEALLRRDENGQTSLMRAAAMDDTISIARILRTAEKHGVHRQLIDMPDYDGNTAILLATQHGNLSAFVLLYEEFANPFYRNNPPSGEMDALDLVAQALGRSDLSPDKRDVFERMAAMLASDTRQQLWQLTRQELRDMHSTDAPLPPNVALLSSHPRYRQHPHP